MMERTGATYLAEWEMILSKFAFNQRIEPGWFDVNAVAN